jgi:uncharacterized membrane protein YgdD (TMEM256/DUF423 family)
MHRSYLLFGAVLAGLAVVLGAFGAHALKAMVPADTVASFQTGVQYQMYHAFALIISAIIYKEKKSKRVIWAAQTFIIGIFLFSGSLYLLTFLKATETVGLSGIGIMTPFGGLFFIAGWIFLAMSVLKKD